MEDFGQVVLGFGGSVAKGDCALKLFAGFGHAIEACEDGAVGFVKAGIVGVVVEGKLEHCDSFFVVAARNEKVGKLDCDGGGVGGGVEAVAENIESLVGFSSQFVGKGEIDALGGSAPVSYTHLDVYKRQGWRK